MRSFTDVFIRNPVLAVVINLIIFMLGWRAISVLPIQQFPQLESSSIVITTVYTGASAENVRGFLTTPIEQAVSAISGVDYIESISRSGISIITIRLKLNHNSIAALSEVTARLQQVRSELPIEAESPTVEIQRADRPYATFYISFTSSERNIPAVSDWLLRTLQPRLSTLEGVQRVNINAGRQIAMRIWLDLNNLASYSLSPGDVRTALLRNNYLAAVGKTKGDLVQVDLLVNSDLRTVEEFKNLIIFENEGAIIRLGDVAEVELGAVEAETVAKYNEEEAVYLGVWPLPGSNEIDVAERLQKEMDLINKTLPDDIEMRLVWDGTMFMREALKNIFMTLLETILIVAIVVFLFMGSIRSALVPLVTMPLSLIGVAIVMFVFDFSLNLLSILALVLSVGLVVDDAIIVVENVARHVRLGASRVNAALTAARELRSPIITMTITLATVYIPIAFQGGLTGSLFLEFAITLSLAVVMSGLVALTLSPVMSSRLVSSYGDDGRLTTFVNRIFQSINNLYVGILDIALNMPWVIVMATVFVIAASWPLHMYSKKELAPIEDQSHISMFFEAAPDDTLESVEYESRKIIDKVMLFDEADYVWSLTSAGSGFGGMVAKNWAERNRSTEEIIADVYTAVSDIPGLSVYPRLDPPLPTPGQYDVEIVIQGDMSIELMLQKSRDVINAGWLSGKFLFVDTDLKVDLPTTRILLDRENLAELGFDLTSVSQELGTLTGGNYVNRFNYYDRSYKVIPQIKSEDRKLDSILNLKIRAPNGDLVPVSNFASIRTDVAPRVLSRFQQNNSVRIFGGLKPGVTKDEGLKVLEKAIKDDKTVSIDYAGESRQIRQEGNTLIVSLGYALILIYLVLAAQFQSFRDPLIVLIGSVPMAISGALIFSFLDFTTLNIYSQVGLITLVGLIAKNGILIVEFANKLQLKGHSKMHAVREAALIRLRPVLMTSAATVFGHIPLVLVIGPGGAARNSIGIMLVAGMAVGTVFTLFVVPVLYSLMAEKHNEVILEDNI